MSMYRYCGAATAVGELKLVKFGQSVEFADDLARDVILGGGCIVPSAEFDKVGFTEQELSIYSNPNSHGQANSAFLAKKRKAQLACAEIRARLERGEPLKASAPESAPAPVPAPSAAN